MSLISRVEAAAEKVFDDIEAGVAEVDGAALREARVLLAEAKTAEGRVVELAGQYKTEIEAAVAAAAPEVKAAVEALVTRLLADFSGLFGAEGD